MRVFFTSALLASVLVEAFALRSPAGERSHHVDVGESPNKAPAEAFSQHSLHHLELPDTPNSNLENKKEHPSHSCLEDEVAKLEDMRAQLRELQALITEQELAIMRRRRHVPMLASDSLPCIAKSVGDQSRHGAHNFVDRPKGSEFSYESRHTPPPPPPPPPPRRRPQLNSPPRTLPHNFAPDKPRDESNEDPIPHRGLLRSSFLDRQSAQRPIRSPSDRANGFQPHTLNSQSISPQGWDKPPRARSSRVFKFLIPSFIIVSSIFVIAALHRRWCRSAFTSTEVESHSRRADRFYRRALRRAARKRIVIDILARLGYPKPIETQEYEDKYIPFLEGIDEAPSSTMGDDISEFRNVAEILSEIVAAEEGRSQYTSARCVPIPAPGESVQELSYPAQDIEVDIGEDLPAYDDDDEGRLGVVADGFRDSNGTEYLPSWVGSASDVLGQETKQ